MRTHFNVVFEEEQNEKHHQKDGEEEVVSTNDKVNLNNYIGSLCEDEFFDE